MFATLYAPPRRLAFQSEEGLVRARSVTDQLVKLARAITPRFEVHGENLVVADARGLSRLVGDARQLGNTLRHHAADSKLYLRIAVAPTRTAGLLMVQARTGLTVIPDGEVAARLEPLPLRVMRSLAHIQSKRGQLARPHGSRLAEAPLAIPAFVLLATVRKWGAHTLGDLARLPATELTERLGSGGLLLQRFARGEDPIPATLATTEALAATVALPLVEDQRLEAIARSNAPVARCRTQQRGRRTRTDREVAA
ncbi:MAG: hypothetical protein VYE68_04105 [Acidobacteriota bacterium]|nr:hypothetical protein [Acidobacteriota bacterium]